MPNPKPVGYYKKGDQIQLIIPEQGQSDDEAIEEFAEDHNLDKSEITKGEPPNDANQEEQGKSDEKETEEVVKPSGPSGESPDTTEEPKVIKAETETPPIPQVSKKTKPSDKVSWLDLAKQTGNGIK
jgi:hypothetical protein